MKIERILKEPGGARVTIGEMEYHFAPQGDGRHVAEVENEGHIQILMGIHEGYRAAEPDGDLDADPDDGPDNDVDLDEDDLDDDPGGDEDAPDSDLADMDDDALRAEFEATVGRKPHPRMLRDTMVAQIQSARDEAAE